MEQLGDPTLWGQYGIGAVAIAGIGYATRALTERSKTEDRLQKRLNETEETLDKSRQALMEAGKREDRALERAHKAEKSLMECQTHSKYKDERIGTLERRVTFLQAYYDKHHDKNRKKADATEPPS